MPLPTNLTFTINSNRSVSVDGQLIKTGTKIFAGMAGDSLSTRLNFIIPDACKTWTKYIDIIKQDGTETQTDNLGDLTTNSFYFDLPHALCVEGKLKMIVVCKKTISGNDSIFQSKEFYVSFDKNIDASGSLVIEYQDTIQQVVTRVENLESGLEQEIADRTAADSTLQSDINTVGAALAQEAIDRAAGDNANATAISDEATARAAADSLLVPKTTTVNGHALSGNITVSKSDVGLGNVPDTDATTTANITDSTDKRFVTDAQKTVLGNTSGTNTGDQTLESLGAEAAGTAASLLDAHKTASTLDHPDGSVKTQHIDNEAITTDKIAIAAVQANQLESGAVTVSKILNKAVTLPKMADVPTSTVFYRKTSGTGPPEVQTLATLKEDLDVANSDLSNVPNGAVGFDLLDTEVINSINKVEIITITNETDLDALFECKMYKVVTDFGIPSNNSIYYLFIENQEFAVDTIQYLLTTQHRFMNGVVAERHYDTSMLEPEWSEWKTEIDLIAGQPNGMATLNGDGKLEQMPAAADVGATPLILPNYTDITEPQLGQLAWNEENLVWYGLGYNPDDDMYEVGWYSPATLNTDGKLHQMPTKSDIGLSNVTNDAQVKASEKGAALGVPTLDASGNVVEPAAKLKFASTTQPYVYKELTLASAAAALETTGLDVNTDKQYIVEFCVKTATTSTTIPRIAVNGDTTLTNYNRVITATAANNNGLYLSGTTNQGDLFEGTITIKRCPLTNKAECYFRTWIRDTSNAYVAAYSAYGEVVKLADVTNITALSIYTTVSNGFDVGSYIRIRSV